MKKFDWDFAPRSAIAYEKVGSKRVWHCTLYNGKRCSVPAPDLDTDGERILWLYGEGVMEHPYHVKV